MNKNIHFNVANFLTENDLIDFIKKKFDFMQKSFQMYTKYFFSLERKILYIFENPYKLEFIKNLEKNYIFDFENKVIYIKNYKSQAKLINILYLIYEDVLKSYLNNYLIKKYQKYLKDYQISFTYSKQFLGRCLYGKRLIEINLLLAKYNPKIFISTLVHEISHIYEQNHSKDFYKKMLEIDKDVYLKQKDVVLAPKNEI